MVLWIIVASVPYLFRPNFSFLLGLTENCNTSFKLKAIINTYGVKTFPSDIKYEHNDYTIKFPKCKCKITVMDKYP